MHRGWIRTARTGSARRYRGRRRLAFTMIEILVAIGIILLLVGLSVAAIGRLARANKKHQTDASLGTLKAMLQNYEGSDEGLTTLLGAYYGDLTSPNPALPIVAPGQTITPPPSPADDHKILVNPTQPTQQGYSPAGVNAFPFPGVGTNNWSAVWRTYQVMRLMYAVPGNRALFEKVPPEQRYYLIDSGTGSQLQPFLLADAYGEPIIFVPPSGLMNVLVEADLTVAPPPANNMSLQSDGRRHSWNAGNKTWTPANPNPRPFWASSGPDHSFTGKRVGAQSTWQARGDDNVYSFDH